MPLATRYVEPRSVCADPLLTEEAARAGDALQAVAVRSMAGLIRQLGSLARHAEGVMGELADSLANCHARTLHLERRTRALAVQVLPSLDPDREALEGFEIPHPDLQFKSQKTLDQRLLSQKHAPPALLDQYSQARAPPDLAQFSAGWEDGRNAMHLYSKPDFFFQNWREGIQRQALRKMSQMDMLSPKHEGEESSKSNGKKKHNLEGSTGSDKVSSFVRPVKRTFSLSRKPLPHKSIHGSSQSLNTDPGGYNTMPSYPGRQGLPLRSSPSFHSVNSRRQQPPNHQVMRSQSLRHKPKKRPKLYSLATTTALLYTEEHPLNLVLPDTTLEESSEYEYSENRTQKKSLLVRRSNSFQKSKSKSPVPGVSTSSVLDSLHMYTVAEELTKLKSSQFSVLSKKYLERLDLGSASFDTCLAIELPRKQQTTFRTPIGMRQRPVSLLELQMVTLRGEGVGGLRASNSRLKHLSAADVLTPVAPSSEDRDSFPPEISNGLMFGVGGIVLRRRISMTGPNSQPRPVSASFVDPPTIKKAAAAAAASRMSLQPHGGSLTDLTSPDSPTQSESPTPKLRPKRPAPQAPGGRPPSRTGTPNSGRSTPKGFRTQSPLIGSRSSQPNFHSPSQSSSNDTLTGMTPNGIGGTPPIMKNHRLSGHALDHTVAPPIPSPPHNLPVFQRNTSSPQLPSSPQLLPAVLHRNTSSPQLPAIPPIQEEPLPVAPGMHSPVSMVINSPVAMTTRTPAIATPSSPRMMNGGIPGPPPPLLRLDSLYVSPRKQSLTVSSVDRQRLRASQILENGGIYGGDLSSSRMDLLAAIRKGIQLKQVEMKERESEDLISMPWDVAAILERRLALELDSDGSETESENTEWEDED